MVSVAVATRRRLGEILVELGIVDDAQIETALQAQQATGKRLGEVLLEAGLVEPRDLVRALAAQFGLPFVDLEERPLDSDLGQMVPRQLAMRHRALPVWTEGDDIIVAMANPVDVLALDDIRSIVGRQVKPVMADTRQILAAVERLGHSDLQVEATIQAAVGEQREVRVATAAAVDTAGDTDRAPIVQFVDLLLSRAVDQHASDIHIEPTESDLRVRYRIDGVLHDVMTPPRSLQAGIVSRLKVMADIDIAERRLPQDGRMTTTVNDVPCDVRVVTIPTVHGEAVVMRLLQGGSERLEIDDLGFLAPQLERFRDAYRKAWGSILVTGPTGSGKSTTLYAALTEICSPSVNIITIEDPVEQRIEGIKQVQVNAKSGMTFSTALRSFLRADPDVILVGEIRDSETAKTAIEASLTGHLVMSTLHTNDALAAPNRLIEMGVEPFLVTSSLSAVVAQRLARQLCDHCRVPRATPMAQLNLHPATAAGLPADFAPDGLLHGFASVGCEYCGGSGYRGRFAIHEVLRFDDTLRSMILAGAPTIETLRHAVRSGMITMRADGLRKVREGRTSIEELLRVTV
jgi:type IV pilus assembly protein PilB